MRLYRWGNFLHIQCFKHWGKSPWKQRHVPQWKQNENEYWLLRTDELLQKGYTAKSSGRWPHAMPVHRKRKCYLHTLSQAENCTLLCYFQPLSSRYRLARDKTKTEEMIGVRGRGRKRSYKQRTNSYHLDTFIYLNKTMWRTKIYISPNKNFVDMQMSSTLILCLPPHLLPSGGCVSWSPWPVPVLLWLFRQLQVQDGMDLMLSLLGPCRCKIETQEFLFSSWKCWWSQWYRADLILLFQRSRFFVFVILDWILSPVVKKALAVESNPSCNSSIFYSSNFNSMGIGYVSH